MERGNFWRARRGKYSPPPPPHVPLALSHAPNPPSPFPFNACHAAGLSPRLGGPGISLGYYEHDPRYFRKKQKENESKRTSWLFSSPPTNCKYSATWNLSDSPDAGYCLAGLSTAIIWLDYSSSVIVLSNVMTADDIFYYVSAMEVLWTAG